MTDNDPTRSASTQDPATQDLTREPAQDPMEQAPDPALTAEGPGYLTETGQAVGDDGSVVPIIGGLPAAAGSSWDIGAPVADRGAGLADELGRPADHG